MGSEWPAPLFVYCFIYLNNNAMLPYKNQHKNHGRQELLASGGTDGRTRNLRLFGFLYYIIIIVLKNLFIKKINIIWWCIGAFGLSCRICLYCYLFFKKIIFVGNNGWFVMMSGWPCRHGQWGSKPPSKTGILTE